MGFTGGETTSRNGHALKIVNFEDLWDETGPETRSTHCVLAEGTISDRWNINIDKLFRGNIATDLIRDNVPRNTSSNYTLRNVSLSSH